MLLGPCAAGGDAHETSCRLGLQGAHNLFTPTAELPSTTKCEAGPWKRTEELYLEAPAQDSAVSGEQRARGRAGSQDNSTVAGLR